MVHWVGYPPAANGDAFLDEVTTLRRSTLLVALASLSGGLGSCSLGSQDFDPGVTAQSERARIERIVVATGTVEPETDLEVRPRIPPVEALRAR